MTLLNDSAESSIIWRVWILLRHSEVSAVSRTAWSKALDPGMSLLGRVQSQNLNLNSPQFPLLIQTLGAGGLFSDPSLAAHVSKDRHRSKKIRDTVETPAPAPAEKVCCASKREEFKNSWAHPWPSVPTWMQDWVLPWAGKERLNWWGVSVKRIKFCLGLHCHWGRESSQSWTRAVFTSDFELWSGKVSALLSVTLV